MVNSRYLPAAPLDASTEGARSRVRVSTGAELTAISERDTPESDAPVVSAESTSTPAAPSAHERVPNAVQHALRSSTVAAKEWTAQLQRRAKLDEMQSSRLALQGLYAGGSRAKRLIDASKRLDVRFRLKLLLDVPRSSVSALLIFLLNMANTATSIVK